MTRLLLDYPHLWITGCFFLALVVSCWKVRRGPHFMEVFGVLSLASGTYVLVAASSS